MILLDALSYLRINILDDVGGMNVSWEDFSEDSTDSYQLRWTNEELVNNITEALNQVYRRILPVKESAATFDITTIIDTREYVLDPRILQIKGVTSSASKLLTEDSIESLWSDKTKGTPTSYVLNYTSGTISFYPLPQEPDTYSLLYYRLPLVPLEWDDNEAEIELRDELVIPMLWYAAALCYDKEDADVIDANRAVYFLQKFNQEFVATSAYSDTRKRSTRNRAIHYGGI